MCSSLVVFVHFTCLCSLAFLEDNDFRGAHYSHFIINSRLTTIHWKLLFQRLRPFFATIESPTPAQWAYSFAGAPAVSLNDADTTCNGGWFIPNYNESRNPFLLMLNGTDISIDAKWRFFVDK